MTKFEFKKNKSNLKKNQNLKVSLLTHAIWCPSYSLIKLYYRDTVLFKTCRYYTKGSSVYSILSCSLLYIVGVILIDLDLSMI